eukprot:5864282-Lingulodinium_polyedra.AAC.1
MRPDAGHLSQGHVLCGGGGLGGGGAVFGGSVWLLFRSLPIAVWKACSVVGFELAARAAFVVSQGPRPCRLFLPRPVLGQ